MEFSDERASSEGGATDGEFLDVEGDGGSRGKN